ncbi:hypothetical protein T4B_6295 [Trichinella pseudospiralis]|uniref:Uncharacterized protein n=1 Tax=Trichinella pseudospiralis TaxID=6337 RepID=A0A0V1IJ62_TRIPS|nr:hypothetical protein T4B_6295 [Trichinella pseudospiralis]
MHQCRQMETISVFGNFSPIWPASIQQVNIHQMDARSDLGCGRSTCEDGCRVAEQLPFQRGDALFSFVAFFSDRSIDELQSPPQTVHLFVQLVQRLVVELLLFEVVVERLVLDHFRFDQQAILAQYFFAFVQQLLVSIRIFFQAFEQVVLGQHEQFSKADAAHAGGSFVFVLVARDVQNAQLTENAAFVQRDEHRDAVFGHHVHHAPLDDVHVLADVTSAEHVVAGAEDLHPQLEHHLRQQAGVAVFEHAGFAQRAHVQGAGHLGAQIQRQQLHNCGLVGRLLLVPEVVEPVENAAPEWRLHFVQFHVPLHTVESVQKLTALHVHADDHDAHVAYERGHDQRAGYDVAHGEHVLAELYWERLLADAGQHQRRPVERQQVVLQQFRIGDLLARAAGSRCRSATAGRPWAVDHRVEHAFRIVHPAVQFQTVCQAHQVVEAGGPVEDQVDDHRQLNCPEEVWKASLGFGHVDKFHQTVGAQQAVEATGRYQR